jgi:hypothetical protein
MICTRKLKYGNYNRSQATQTVLLTGFYAVRVTNTGTVVAKIDNGVELQPGDSWVASGDAPGDELVGQIEVVGVGGPAALFVETQKA